MTPGASVTARVVEFVAIGGVVMYPLFALGVATWTALLMRAFELLLGWRGPMDALVENPEAASRRGVLSDAARGAAPLVTLPEAEWRLRAHFDRIRRRAQLGKLSTDTMIAAAPLLGLLGTLTGMIETFEVLGVRQQAGYMDAMARGISKALITTEFGLFISIPGILASRALHRREARIQRNLDELEARFKALSMECVR